LNNNIHNNGLCATVPACLSDMTGAKSGYGLYGSQFALIEGNEIHHNTGFGIHNYGNHVSNNIFRKNIIHDNGTMDHASAAVLLGGHDNLFYNNIIYNEGGTGISVHYSDPQNNQVYNNTIYNVANWGGEAGIWIATEAINTTVRNNIVTNTATPIM